MPQVGQPGSYRSPEPRVHRRQVQRLINLLLFADFALRGINNQRRTFTRSPLVYGKWNSGTLESSHKSQNFSPLTGSSRVPKFQNASFFLLSRMPFGPFANFPGIECRLLPICSVLGAIPPSPSSRFVNYVGYYPTKVHFPALKTLKNTLNQHFSPFFLAQFKKKHYLCIRFVKNYYVST